MLTIDDKGHCFGWGFNEHGQVGLGKFEKQTNEADDIFRCINKPTPIRELENVHIVMVAAGHSHSLFLTDLGQVYAAGYNLYG